MPDKRTAVQILFDGHDGGIVADVAQAVERLSMNLNDGKALAPFASEYPELASLGHSIPDLHRLALLAQEDGRESVDVVIHDLDAHRNHGTEMARIRLVDPNDPDMVLSCALLRLHAAWSDGELEELSANVEERMEIEMEGALDPPFMRSLRDHIASLGAGRPSAASSILPDPEDVAGKDDAEIARMIAREALLAVRRTQDGLESLDASRDGPGR